MNKEVVEKLLLLGAPANNSGFRYVIEAMEIFKREEDKSMVRTGDLYEEIASKFNTTYTCVERSIRYLFICIYNNKIPSVALDYFPKRRTGNGDMLARLYYWLKAEKE